MRARGHFDPEASEEDDVFLELLDDGVALAARPECYGPRELHPETQGEVDEFAERVGDLRERVWNDATARRFDDAVERERERGEQKAALEEAKQRMMPAARCSDRERRVARSHARCVDGRGGRTAARARAAAANPGERDAELAAEQRATFLTAEEDAPARRGLRGATPLKNL